MKPTLNIRPACRGLALAGWVASIAIAAAQSPITTVILGTGDNITTGATVETIDKLNPPSVTSTGAVGFMASLRPAGGGTSYKAIVGGTPLRVLMRKGDQAPEYWTGVVIGDFFNPVFRGADEFAVQTKLAGSIPTAFNGAVYANTGGGLLHLVVEKDTTGTNSNYGYGWSVSVALPEVDAGVGYGAAVSLDNNAWVQETFTGVDQGTRYIAGNAGIRPFGDPNGPFSLRYTALGTVSGSPGTLRQGRRDGSIVFLLDLRKRTEESPFESAYYIFTRRRDPAGGGTVDEIVARTGQEITLRGSAAPAKFAAFYAPAFAGGYAFRATLQRNIGGVLASNDTIITDGATDFAREGDAAPGFPPGAVFKGFGEPVACGAGRPAFYATVALDGLSVLSNSGIWIDDDGTAATPVVSVAQEGAPAPGTAGAVFHGFSSLAGLDSATEGPVFVARLRSGVGGVDTTNNVGIWARCNDGVVRKLIRTGETLSVGGQPKVVRSIQALLNLPGSSGQARTYVNAGSITYLVTFAGGTQAIVQTTIP